METVQGVQWPRKARVMGRDRQLPDAEQLRDPLQGQQWLQPARVTPASKGTGVSPAGCSSGCCGAVAGGLRKGQGVAMHFALDLNHQKEEGRVARLSKLGSVGLEDLGLLVCKCWAHLDSFPSTFLHCFEFGSNY